MKTKYVSFYLFGITALVLITALVYHTKRSDTPQTRPDQSRVINSPLNLPLSFEANTGQTDDRVHFLSRGKGYTLYLTPTEAVLALTNSRQTHALRLQLNNANPTPEITGLEKQQGVSNYFKGNNPNNWQKSVPHYSKVHYAQVYPGIDLVYYGTENQQLEHDFIVSPGTDPDIIRFTVAGADDLSLDTKGNLHLQLSDSEIILDAPITYQEINGQRHSVESRYILYGTNEVGFELASYDVEKPVVIDPILKYSSFLGGTGGDEGFGIALDSAGNIYVAGKTNSTDFPTQNAYQNTYAGGIIDAFVTKMDPSGSTLIYSTFIGGSDLEAALDIAVDSAGNAYLGGHTQSTDFPTQNPFQGALAGVKDLFIVKLNATGSALVYSTYIGGTGDENGYGLDVDSSGQAYITGETFSSNFPTANPAQPTLNGSHDVAIVKLNAAGSAMIYSTFLGGSGSGDRGYGIKADAAGNAYVCGRTTSSDFPTQNGYQLTFGGVQDGFIVKMSPTGSVIYATYVGGSSDDWFRNLDIDSAGNVYATGFTLSTNYPTQNPFQATHAGPSGRDMIVTKLNTSGTALVYSTYLGGTSTDEAGQGIAVDSQGRAYVSGFTTTSDFPLQDPIQATYNGGISDATIARFSASGNTLEFSTLLGGSNGWEYAKDIVLDQYGNVYATGLTQSSDFPTQTPYQATYLGNESAFVFKMGSAQFTDLAGTAGINHPANIGGIGWADYDSDGDLDLYLANFTGANSFYRNNSNGTFSEIASSIGVSSGGTNSAGITWADYDNDGDLDIYLTDANGFNSLFRNNGGTFSNEAASAGVNHNGPGHSAAWADYDNDGHVDLYVTNSPGNNLLYRNLGNGTFTNVAGTAGVNDNGSSPATAWADYDNDGDPDLLVTRTDGADLFYQNNIGVFTNIAGSIGINNAGKGYGAAWGDYDNDGDLDLYIPNESSPNTFFRNDGASFSEIGSTLGVNDSGIGHGGAWADYDNDGDLDLFTSNSNGSQVNLLYQNSAGSFSDVASAAGVQNVGGGGRSATWADYDNDGDLDLYLVVSVGNNRLYRNNGNANKYLIVDLEGAISNRSGIGAVVTAVTGSLRQRKEIDGGSGFLTQPSLPVEFGFGTTTTIDSLIIQWPSGISQTQTNLAVNQSISVTEQLQFTEVAATAGVNAGGRGFSAAWGDHNADGYIDLYVANELGGSILYENNTNGTFTNIAGTLGMNGRGQGVAWSDFNNDGNLDIYVANNGINKLFRNNGNGTYTDIANSAGVDDAGDGLVVAWGDYDQDGDTDLYLDSQGALDQLFQNNGNETFTDVASTLGINGGSVLAGGWVDYDQDGDLDLHLGNHSYPVSGKLYENDGLGNFTDIAPTLGLTDPGRTRGIAWGDFDNDGDFDVYIANQVNSNVLYQNNANSAFIPITGSAGIGGTGSTSQGVLWLDYDHDGDIDLYLNNTGGSTDLYKNNGNSTFTNVANDAGINYTSTSQGVAAGDYDNDGDIDIYLVDINNPNLLYQNNQNDTNYLFVQTLDASARQTRHGTTISVFQAGTSTLLGTRLVDGGGHSYLSQSEYKSHFGLPAGGSYDVHVLFPSGAAVTESNVNATQTLTITEIPLTVTIPDTTANYASDIKIPVRISNTSSLSIVAVELQITFDKTIVTPGSPDKTDIVGTLVASGWSVEENIFSSAGNIDTLSIAMSTAQDTLTGSGSLIDLVFETADIRSPASTALDLVHVLFNDGTPASTNIDGSLTLTGTDGIIDASPDSINPGNVVNITVTDTDLDLDVGNPDQVSATAISKLYNDIQTITLTETGANTGIFAGTLNTLFALTAGPSEDGFIGTIAGDSICVSFSDVLTSVGTTVTRYDTVEVIGGEDGVVVASFVVQALDSRNGVRDTVRVQVTDSDLDVDVGVADQVSVTIVNASSGESELVTLTETGVTTGIFQARVPTIFGASGTTNDGELSLASQDDSLGTAYVDALTSQGGGAVLDAVTYVVNLFGDVRFNDNVQAFDAASILAHAVGLNTYTFRDSLLGDVDGNGDVQAFDASQVLQYVVRLIDRFPVQTDDSITPPGDLKNHPFLKPVPLNQIIALGQLQPQGDGTHLLPIQLTDRQGVLSATLELNHSEHIQVLDVSTDVAYDGFMVAHNAEKDRVRIAFAGAQSHTSGSGNMLYLHIKATGEVQFSLDHVVLNGHTLTPTAPLEVITQIEPATPLVYALHQNQPNPFNPETVIRYDLPEASQVRVTIHNVLGQQIHSLVSAYQEAGAHHVIWNAKDVFGRDISSGVYFIKLEAGSFSQIRKMMLLR